MIITFNTKESQVTEKRLETMKKKIHQRFDRYFTHEEDDHTVFHVKIVEKKLQYKVELNLPYLGYQLRAETTDKQSSLAALDKSMDVLERQMRKAKTKVARGKTQAPKLKDEKTSTTDNSDYNVVRVKSYEMKPISTQEAIANMDLLGHNFYTFLNRDTKKISTVYRRNDGDYGLIEPL